MDALLNYLRPYFNAMVQSARIVESASEPVPTSTTTAIKRKTGLEHTVSSQERSKKHTKKARPPLYSRDSLLQVTERLPIEDNRDEDVNACRERETTTEASSELKRKLMYGYTPPDSLNKYRERNCEGKRLPASHMSNLQCI